MDAMPALPSVLADRLVESVPNVSEGRRLDVVERLATALSSVAGVHLLDRTSDASHNRSVFTLAGAGGAGGAALCCTAAKGGRGNEPGRACGERPPCVAVA